MIYYTGKMLQFLENRRTLTHKALTAAFNEKYGASFSVNQIATLCQRNGFWTGRTGRFPKGHKAWNSDLKGKGICKPNRGCFKKGHLPQNHRPVGSERIDVDRYLYVKTAEPNVWRMKHVLVWEEAHGPIPNGFILRFRDGNSLNCRIDNLELMNRSLHVRLNKLQYRAAPKAIKPTLHLVAQIQSRFSRAREVLRAA